MLLQLYKNRTRKLVAESCFRDELTASPVAATIRFRNTITPADRPQTKHPAFQRQKLVPEMVDTLQANKDLVHRLYNTLMAHGDIDSAKQILADDYVDHDLPGTGEGGKAQVIQVVQGVRASFPDITPTLYETLAEGDLVSVRVIAPIPVIRRWT